MIKYSGSTIEDWFYSETPINKMYYNGRVTYLKLKEEEPDYKFIAQYSNGSSYSAECDGGSALTQSMVEGHTTPKSAMTKAYVYTCDMNQFKIGDNAFSGCSSLSSLTLDDKITVLGNQAFMRCSGLTSFHFPSKLTKIEGSCFRLSGIKNINGIPSGVTYISSGAFADMYNLSAATIPASITGSSTNLFLRDSALKEVHFKRRTAPELGEDAFKDCTALVKIYIPDCDCFNSYKAQSQFSGKTGIIYGENGTRCYTPPYIYFTKSSGSYLSDGFTYTANTDGNLTTLRKSASNQSELTASCYVSFSGVSSIKFTQTLSNSGSGLYYSANITGTSQTASTRSVGAYVQYTNLTKTKTYNVQIKLLAKSQGQTISGSLAAANITWTQ